MAAIAPGRAGRPAPTSGCAPRHRPHRVLIGPETPGAAGDWTKHSSVVVKFSAFLKGPAFPVLEGVDPGLLWGSLVRRDSRAFLHHSVVPILGMASRCFFRGTCSGPKISPPKRDSLSPLPSCQAQPMKREQTCIDRQSQRIYYRYIQCAPATPPHTPGPQRLLQAVMGAAHNPVPSLPWEVLQPEACRERASPRPSPREVAFTAGGGRREEDSFEL